MTFIPECDIEYTAYREQLQVCRLLASIKRTCHLLAPSQFPTGFIFYIYKHFAIQLTPIVTHIHLTLLRSPTCIILKVWYGIVEFNVAFDGKSTQ